MLLLFESGQTAAWLLALLSGVVGALLVWPVAAALRAIPRGTLVDLAEAALGRWNGILAGLLFAAVFCFAAGMILREASEMALTAVFPHTPQTFVTTALMLGAVYAAWGDGPSLVRLGRMLLPMLLLSLLIILVGSIGWGEFRYLFPLWGPGIPRLLMGLPGAIAIYFPVVSLTALTDNVQDRRELVHGLMAVPLLGGSVLAVIQALLLIVLAYPIGMGIPFPLHAAARLVMGGRFFERLEGIWVFVWVTTTTILLGVLLYASSRLFAQAFRMPRRQTAILPLATVILTIAFFPKDQAQTIAFHLSATPPLFIVVFFYPTLVALIALFRRWRASL